MFVSSNMFLATRPVHVIISKTYQSRNAVNQKQRSASMQTTGNKKQNKFSVKGHNLRPVGQAEVEVHPAKVVATI